MAASTRNLFTLDIKKGPDPNPTENEVMLKKIEEGNIDEQDSIINGIIKEV
jgi:hypothetical protein